MESIDARGEWEARIAACRASGQKAAAWCREHGISRRQLYWWMKKLADENAGAPEPSAGTRPAQWLAVQVDRSPEDVTSLDVKVGSAVIEVKQGFDPALLRDVVKALKSSC